MLVSTTKLKKLRNRSLHELCVRGRQEGAKWAERLSSVVSGEPSDEAWLRGLHPASRRASCEASASFILQRIRTSADQTFFSSLGCRSEIVALMNSRFESQRLRLIASADRICSGRFDLL